MKRKITWTIYKMKNRYKFIFGLLIVLIALAWIVIEPFGKNPFAKNPKLFAKSEVIWENDTSNFSTQLFQAKADSVLNNAILLNDFIGVSAGVYQNGKAQYLAQAGLKDKSTLTQSDKNTKHRIASISKPITAVAIMKLVAQGKLELHIPVQKYLPAFPINPQGDITIHHLLKHTSGIAHYKSTFDAMSFSKYESQAEALEAIQDRPFKFAPGTDFEYTTFGYTVLGAIIEKVTGQELNDFLTEVIFKPAEMENTDLENGNLSYDNKASLYVKAGNTFVKSPKTQLSIKYAGGGVHSTAEDLLKFGKAILENKLIDSLTLSQMINAADTLKEGTPYGYGWDVIESKTSGRILQHGGSQAGASSFLQVYLDKNIVVASIANNFNSSDEVYLLSRNLANLFLKEDAMKNPVNYFVEQPVKVLKNVAGTYELEEEVLEISRKGKALEIIHKPYPTQLVFPSSANTFFYRYFDGKIVFDEKGLVYFYRGEPNRYVKRD